MLESAVALLAISTMPRSGQIFNRSLSASLRRESNLCVSTTCNTSEHHLYLSSYRLFEMYSFWGRVELYNSKISCVTYKRWKNESALQFVFLATTKRFINWAIVMLNFIYMPIYTRLFVFGMIRYLGNLKKKKNTGQRKEGRQRTRIFLFLASLSFVRSLPKRREAKQGKTKTDDGHEFKKKEKTDKLFNSIIKTTSIHQT